jgi:hypothetical protein
MRQVLRIKIEKDRDQLKCEKKNLEFLIANLLKEEGTKAKMRKIRELSEE